MIPSADPISISVLVRTFNSAKTLGRLLSALKLRDGEEFLIVDSGSTDSTLALAEAHCARIIPAPGPFNYSKSLNLGFQEARNPWVLVISSHTIPVIPDLLEEFRTAALQFPDNVAVAYGPNSLNGQGPFDDDRIRYYSPDDHMTIHPYGGNGNTLYRRVAWVAVPFDEGIRTGEDKAWLTQAMAKGFHAAFVSRARTININQYSLRYMFMKGYSDCRALPHQPRSVLDLAGAGFPHKKISSGWNARWQLDPL